MVTSTLSREARATYLGLLSACGLRQLASFASPERGRSQLAWDCGRHYGWTITGG